MSKLGVKNRAPAPIQITAEQLLREAQERGLEDVAKPPKQFITDKEELAHFQLTKRKDFEDQLRRQRQHIGLWCRYALWEASQMEFERARSVFERALDVDYRNQTLWLKYADMEMKNKFINHARNVWDRAVTFHPRVDAFWYKYSYMEETVGAIENARQVFARWMEWEPDDLAWAAYIKFEMRQGEVDLARALYEKYVYKLPTCRAYLKYARWEESQHEYALARQVYERALSELHPMEKSEKLLIAFARFEERCKEFDRARCIYQYAIQHFSSRAASDSSSGLVGDDDNADDKQSSLAELKKEFIMFEKKHGSRAQIEGILIQSKIEQYEQQIQQEPYYYDTWFDYARFLESEGQDLAAVRKVYERAVQYRPLREVKNDWKRYIYLWIYWAVFEELVAQEIDQARQVYQQALACVPHARFTFGKLWLLAATFELRTGHLPACRKLLGTAIGLCGKPNLFQGYIDLEMQLGEVQRCRQLYAKYLEARPASSTAWLGFAQLEYKVGEVVRAREIWEVAIDLPEMDQPEVLWKAYIEMEVREGERERARELFERLVERSGHVKVWMAFATFEFQAEADKEARVEDAAVLARDVYTRGYAALKQAGLKEERLLLLEAWRDMEAEALKLDLPGSSRDRLAEVEGRFPRKIKMRRQVSAEEGADGEPREEEYFDYIFPDDEKKLVGMKLLEKALAWKSAGAAASGVEVSEAADSVLGKRSAEE